MAEPAPEQRRGMPPVRLDEAGFKSRFKARYADDSVADALEKVAAVAGTAVRIASRRA